MLRRTLSFGRLIVAAVFASAGGMAAAGERIDFSGELATGVKYDSNVSVLDLDTHTDRADVALLTDAGFGARVALTQGTRLKLGADWTQTLYQDASAFDLSIRQASAAIEHDAGPVKTGLSLHHAHAELGDEAFLGMRRLSPSLARLFGRRLYLRGAWVRTDKTHRRDAGRSAVNDGFSADAFLFLDGTSRYLALGWLAGREDARQDDFDYRSKRLRLTYAHSFEWTGIEVALKSRLQLERRAYRQELEAPFPLTEPERRSDERWRAALFADVPLNEWLTLQSALEYARNASNLASADFDEVSYSARLAAAF